MEENAQATHEQTKEDVSQQDIENASVERLSVLNALEDARKVLSAQELRCKAAHCHFLLEVIERERAEARVNMLNVVADQTK